MDSETNKIAARTADRLETRARLGHIVDAGVRILGDSNLVRTDNPIGPHDVELVRRFIYEGVPITEKNYSLHAHLQLSAEFARKLGEQLKTKHPDKYSDLNLDELEALGLWHDFSKPVVGFRFYRDEIAEGLVARNIGIRQDFLDKVRTVKEGFGKNPNDPEDLEVEFDSMPVEKRIELMADICGKRRVEDWGIKTFDETMEYHWESRTELDEKKDKAMYPSETRISRELIEFDYHLYKKIKDWLSEEGIDVGHIRQQILHEEESSSIRGVVWDLGGVIIPNTEGQLRQTIAEAFGVGGDQLEGAISDDIQLIQEDKISIDEYWHRVAKKLGKPLPDNYQNLLLSVLSTEVDPEIRKIITMLGRNYSQAILTDTARQHMEVFEREKVYSLVPTVIASPDIGVTKRNQAAFQIAALKLWLPPQACLFIDDNQSNVDKARESKMKAIKFTSTEQLKQDLTALGIQGSTS